MSPYCISGNNQQVTTVILRCKFYGHLVPFKNVCRIQNPLNLAFFVKKSITHASRLCAIILGSKLCVF